MADTPAQAWIYEMADQLFQSPSLIGGAECLLDDCGGCEACEAAVAEIAETLQAVAAQVQRETKVNIAIVAETRARGERISAQTGRQDVAVLEDFARWLRQNAAEAQSSTTTEPK